MLRLWLRIFIGVVIALALQYIAATAILGENDLDSYELAGFTISNGHVYYGLVDERGGMKSRDNLIEVLENIKIPLCDLHILDELPHAPETAQDIPVTGDIDFDWEELCETYPLLRLTLPENNELPPSYLFFIDNLRPIVAFQTDDKQTWLAIDPVGDGQWSIDWYELVPFFLLNGIIAVFLSWFVSGSLARRIQRLSKLSQSFAEGNFDTRAPNSGKDAVSILGSNFNSMADSLQRVIEDQRDLLRAVAHELRTPLARIGVAVGIAEIKNPHITDQMKSIQDDLQELENLIAEITEYLCLEHGQSLIFERVELKQLAEEVVGQELHDLDHLQIIINAEEDGLHITGHRTSMKRCLSNVVRNAGRYARHTIQISLATSDKKLTLTVEDDGPGFPGVMLEELTTAFVTTANGRLGLGLALCRRIVELSGGTLSLHAQSSIGGAGVEISLPKPAS